MVYILFVVFMFVVEIVVIFVEVKKVEEFVIEFGIIIYMEKVI